MKKFLFFALLIFSLLILLPSFLPLQAQTSCSGVVTDSQTSEPIPNVTITVYFSNGTQLEEETSISDPGHYSINIASVVRNINFRANGYAQHTFTPEVGNDDQCPGDVTLNPASAIFGWDCVNGTCAQKDSSGGQYEDEATCRAECSQTGFYCNPDIKACDTIARSGQTKHSTRQACDTACTQPSAPNCAATNTCSSGTGGSCNPDNPINDRGEPQGEGGVWTAIGCIPTSPQVLISKSVGLAAGIGGGIALLLMIFGAVQMITSAGNPEAIKKGRDQFVAAAVGLLFVIFSTLLLKIIGVDILNIPGFN